MSVETRSVKSGLRFSRNALMPSFASRDTPSAAMPAVSTSCASIGCDAPSMRHIICRTIAIDTAEELATNSCARACAAGKSSSGSCKLRSKPEEFGDMVRARFRMGGLFTSGEYVQAQRVRNVIKRDFAKALQHVDLIASPTMSNPAPAFQGIDVMTTARVPSFTGPYNVTGMPAISVPCGFTPKGLPVGLQLAGKPFDEPTVLRAAYTFQQHVRLFEKRPPV